MGNILAKLLEYSRSTEAELSENTDIPIEELNRYARHPHAQISQEHMPAIARYFNVDERLVCGLQVEVSGEVPQDVWEEISEKPEFRDIILYKRCSPFKWCKVYFRESHQPQQSTGFIAMSFDFDNPELVGIRDAIKNAILATGYDPDIMSESSRNGYILPHMLEAIKNCEFLVLDATYANCSAYLEAGYAMALDKEVIISCKRSVFKNNSVPFDIAQWNLALWDDYEELETEIMTRIRRKFQK